MLASDSSFNPLNRWRRVSLGLGVFLLLLLLALPQAALLPLIDRDEPRFAEASRELLENGDYVVPTFNGAPRYAKPPLIYWAQAACFQLGGEIAFTARLPSLVATAGTGLLLFFWGAELAGLGAGLLAALAYGLCLQAMAQGRAATADALLIFFTTASAFAGWKLLLLAGTGRARAWCVWGSALALALAAGFLAKGPEALLPVVPLLWLLRSKGARAVGSVTAILALALLLVSIWAVPAYTHTQGAYWREGLGHDVGDRMVTGFQGHGASSFGWYLLELPLYLVLFWISALPWSPLLIAKRRALFSAWSLDDADIYLLLQAALYFLIFSLMVTKLPHYTLPAYPFLALILVRRWAACGLAVSSPAKILLGTGVAIALVALLLIPLGVLPRFNPSPCGVLVRAAAHDLTAHTACALVDFQEPTAIWELRGVVGTYPKAIPEREVLPFLRQPGGHAVILGQAVWKRLSRDAPPGLHIYSTRGTNAAKLAFVDLVLVVKPGDTHLVSGQKAAPLSGFASSLHRGAG